MFNKISFIFIVYVLVWHNIDASPVSLNSECSSYFDRYNSCPEKGLDYHKVNNLCCGNSTTEQKLHCAVTYEKGRSKITKGCFQDIAVPKGHFMYMHMDSSLRIQKCDDNRYEPEERLSSNLKYSYCPHLKSTCDGDGQQRLCKGSASTDNQCACKPGYQPEYWPQDKGCSRGFGREDTCPCIKKACPEGTRRNITWHPERLCPAGGPIPLDYHCYDNNLFTSASGSNHMKLNLATLMLFLSVVLILSQC